MANMTTTTVQPTATGMSSMTKATLPNNLRHKAIDKTPILSSPTDMANRTRVTPKADRKITDLTIDSTTQGTNNPQREVDIILQMVGECKDRHSSRGIRTIEGTRLSRRDKTHGMAIPGIAPTIHLSRKLDVNRTPEMVMETEGTPENQQ